MRCFAVSSQSEERSDGLLSATGLARRVGASIRVHKSPRYHRGGSRDIRPFDRVQPYGCAGYVGDLYS